jgi:hypothetical protein
MLNPEACCGADPGCQEEFGWWHVPRSDLQVGSGRGIACGMWQVAGGVCQPK